MNIQATLITLTLLCILHASSVFAAQPASADLPDLLQAELAKIDDMPDYEVLCSIAPVSQDESEQLLELAEEKQGLKKHCAMMMEEDPMLALLVKSHSKLFRSSYKYELANNALATCNDNAARQALMLKRDECAAQNDASQKEAQSAVDSLIVNGMIPVAAYSNTAFQLNIYRYQAMLLLNQKEKQEQVWKQKEIKWQQERQALLAMISQNNNQ